MFCRHLARPSPNDRTTCLFSTAQYDLPHETVRYRKIMNGGKKIPNESNDIISWKDPHIIPLLKQNLVTGLGCGIKSHRVFFGILNTTQFSFVLRDRSAPLHQVLVWLVAIVSVM